MQGWREITIGTGKLFVNDSTKTAIFLFSRTGTITSEISYANTIPEGYRPYSIVRMKAHNSALQAFVDIETNGTVKLSGATTSSSVTISCQITYGYGL